MKITIRRQRRVKDIIRVPVKAYLHPDLEALIHDTRIAATVAGRRPSRSHVLAVMAADAAGYHLAIEDRYETPKPKRGMLRAVAGGRR